MNTPARVNTDFLTPIPWRPEDETRFRGLLHIHAQATGSTTAQALLADWPATLQAFSPFVPHTLAAPLPSEKI